MVDDAARAVQITLDTQARQIARLLEQNRQMDVTILELQARIAETESAGAMYLSLQKLIMENPILQSEWTRFCTFLKLSVDEDIPINKRHSVDEWYVPVPIADQ